MIDAFPLPEQDLGPRRTAIFTAEESQIAHDHQLMPLALGIIRGHANPWVLWGVLPGSGSGLTLSYPTQTLTPATGFTGID
jgi:hypothetical protein